MVHEDKNDFSDGAKKDVLEMFELFKHMLNTSIGIYRDEDYAQYSALMEDKLHGFAGMQARQSISTDGPQRMRDGCRRQRLRYSETWNVWLTIAAASPAVRSKPPPAGAVLDIR